MVKALFISEQYIKDNSPINPNVNSKVIYFTSWTTQEEKLKPALGAALYDRLAQGIIAQDLTTDEKSLLDEYVRPALLFYVLAELPQELTYKTTNKGLTTKGASQEGSEVMSMAEIAVVINRYSSKGDVRLSHMIEHLNLVARTSGPYKEYLAPAIGSNRPNKRAFKSAINLTPLCELRNAGTFNNLNSLETPVIYE